ncbi:autorepressor SdpR family transcription factor [Enterococcus sp. BWR-S5]|uniref:autorepressor SdpR family transcription factor n=1 Tax=Enterococcus sp. BWR-S5 TaxID=2787714 RepID=UPI001EFFB478|nr:autorepressor SdpR family transcription factor [Enterococcus sp. BWR-S5]
MSISESFKALAVPMRREILDLLKEGRMSAGDIASHFNVTQPAISYHLTILKKANLIYESKYKNFIYYELNTTVFDNLIIWLKTIKGDEEE